MKFTITVFSLTLASSLLFAAGPVQACEASCQTGISNAFSDGYSIEVDNIFSKFTTKLTTSPSLFAGVKAHTKLKKEITNSITATITNQKNNFQGTLSNLVKNSIFNENPRFKGQCQNPLRVKQPPAGVNWTLSDCQKQDYICGNPPAICHFMNQIVKPRNVKDIDNALVTLVKSTDFSGVITKGIESVASKQGLTGKELEAVVNGVSNNVNNTLPGFSSDFVAEFCSVVKGSNATTCDKYDANIKSLLLSFP